MKVICISNKGFNGQLTIGREYDVFMSPVVRSYIKSDLTIEGIFWDHLFLDDLIKSGAVMSIEEMREKRLNILLG